MVKLTYAAIASLDGYVADREGSFAWSAPDEDVHEAVNDLMRSVGTLLLGRRMYDVLVAWETMDTSGEPPALRDYAELWRASDKVVYSTTLDEVASARTRLERTFDPGGVERLKATASRDLSIGGPNLAAQAIHANLVDEIHLFLNPIVVGGGTRALPEHAALKLELLDERRFRGGVVSLSYRVEREIDS